MRIQPTVTMSSPLTLACTANASTAPTAIKKRLTPIPIISLLVGPHDLVQDSDGSRSIPGRRVCHADVTSVTPGTAIRPAAVLRGKGAVCAYAHSGDGSQ